MKNYLKITIGLLMVILLFTMFNCIKPEPPIENKETDGIINYTIGEDMNFLIPGYTYHVEWTSYDVSEVNIELMGVLKEDKDNNLQTVLIIDEGLNDEGTYSWTVPNDFVQNYNSIYKNNKYRLVISNANGWTDFTEKNIDLMISYPSVTVDNLGKSYLAGYKSDIDYTYSGKNFIANIELYKGEEFYGTIAEELTFTNEAIGSYNWEISSKMLIGEDYNIRFKDTTNGKTYEVEHNDFSIDPVIYIASSILKAGSTESIDFTYTGTGFEVDVDLYKGDTLSSTIASNILFDESGIISQSCDISDDIQIGDYTIKLKNSETGKVYGEKNSITPVVPIIDVTSPSTDGLVLTPSNTYNITWNKTGSFSHVDISFVSDTGYTTTVAEKVSNTGSYNWTVPSDITISNSKIMVRVAEENKYFSRISSSLISGYSDKKLSIYSLCSGLDEVIDDFGTEMLDTGREALKDITKIHLSEEEEDEEIDPNPDGPLRSSKDEDEDRKGDQEIDRDGLISRLKELHWQINEDPEGPTEYYNEETGETIIVNEDSDYDMEIVYSIDENEPTLQMLIQENPRGGADIYAYYNVWLRSRETKEPIHEERMRMKYEYIIEEQDQDEVNHDIRIGAWQRTGVEMSFNYDEEYEAGEKNSDDKVVWEYYEIRNNGAETVWCFYYGKIFSPLIFMQRNYENEINSPQVDILEGERDAYYEYVNTYDTRLTVKKYSPSTRNDWNDQNPEDEISSNKRTVIYKYYFEGEELFSVGVLVNNGKMIPIIKEKDWVYAVPMDFVDENGDIIDLQQTQNENFWDKNFNNLILIMAEKLRNVFTPFMGNDMENSKDGVEWIRKWAFRDGVEQAVGSKNYNTLVETLANLGVDILNDNLCENYYFIWYSDKVSQISVYLNIGLVTIGYTPTDSLCYGVYNENTDTITLIFSTEFHYEANNTSDDYNANHVGFVQGGFINFDKMTGKINFASLPYGRYIKKDPVLEVDNYVLDELEKKNTPVYMCFEETDDGSGYEFWYSTEMDGYDKYGDKDDLGEFDNQYKGGTIPKGKLDSLRKQLRNEQRKALLERPVL